MVVLGSHRLLLFFKVILSYHCVNLMPKLCLLQARTLLQTLVVTCRKQGIQAQVKMTKWYIFFNLPLSPTSLFIPCRPLSGGKHCSDSLWESQRSQQDLKTFLVPQFPLWALERITQQTVDNSIYSAFVMSSMLFVFAVQENSISKWSGL